MTTEILSAEFVGMARTEGGVLDVGGVKIHLGLPDIGVYVRRISSDLSVIEVVMARHDGLAQEELDRQNDEADRYPLGPKEYWRAVQVGKWTYGVDGHVMTDEEFEQDWYEGSTWSSVDGPHPHQRAVDADAPGAPRESRLVRLGEGTPRRDG